jgi:protoheme IX farnesyltransferase
MLPVVRGEAVTRRQILLYSLLLVGITLLPYGGGLFGLPYLASALTLGATFVGLAAGLSHHPSRRAALRLYLASLVYLALLFTAMALDRVL